MAKAYYDRYKFLRRDGLIMNVPPLKIDIYETDLYITYNVNKMRMDSLSYKYYGDANYGWLIMLSNPQYGSMEFEIPNGVTMRIPYPLDSAISRYERKIQEYLAN